MWNQAAGHLCLPLCPIFCQSEFPCFSCLTVWCALLNSGLQDPQKRVKIQEFAQEAALGCLILLVEKELCEILGKSKQHWKLKKQSHKILNPTLPGKCYWLTTTGIWQGKDLLSLNSVFSHSKAHKRYFEDAAGFTNKQGREKDDEGFGGCCMRRGWESWCCSAWKRLRFLSTAPQDKRQWDTWNVLKPDFEGVVVKLIEQQKQITQRNCAFSVQGIQNSTSEGLAQPAVGEPALSRSLEKVISRHSSWLQPFCVLHVTSWSLFALSLYTREI